MVEVVAMSVTEPWAAGDPRLHRPEWRGRTNVDALTIACIERAEHICGHEFVITQGSYQAGSGDPDSAGTHDRGGVFDAADCGHPTCLRALRQVGLAAWLRTPAQGPWGPHYHCVVIGHPNLASSAAMQVEDYFAGRNGLKGRGPDDGPRLDPIPRPVWPYDPEEEALMAAADQILSRIATLDKKLDRVLDKQNASREREVRTNALLRKIRALVQDSVTLAEIDELLKRED